MPFGFMTNGLVHDFWDVGLAQPSTAVRDGVLWGSVPRASDREFWMTRQRILNTPRITDFAGVSGASCQRYTAAASNECERGPRKRG